MKVKATQSKRKKVGARPYNRYNCFFILERERIILAKGGTTKWSSSESDAPSDGSSASSLDPFVRGYDGLVLLPLPPRFAHMAVPDGWCVPGRERKRPHRRSHGVATFRELAQSIAASWKGIDGKTLDFCTGVEKALKRRYGELTEKLEKLDRQRSETIQRPGRFRGSPAMSARPMGKEEAMRLKARRQLEFLPESMRPKLQARPRQLRRVAPAPIPPSEEQSEKAGRPQPSQPAPRQTEPKEVEPKQAEPKQAEPMQAEPKHVEVKSTQFRRVTQAPSPPPKEQVATARQLQPRQLELTQTEPQQAESKQVDPKQAEPKQSQSKQVDPKEVQSHQVRRVTEAPLPPALEVEPRPVEPRQVEPGLVEPRLVWAPWQERRLLLRQIRPGRVAPEPVRRANSVGQIQSQQNAPSVAPSAAPTTLPSRDADRAVPAIDDAAPSRWGGPTTDDLVGDDWDCFWEEARAFDDYVMDGVRAVAPHPRGRPSGRPGSAEELGARWWDASIPDEDIWEMWYAK